MGYVVTLDAAEMSLAMHVGNQRWTFSELRGHKNRAVVNSSTIHLVGAMGELAVCKAFGVFWAPTLDGFKDRADIGTRTDVKTRQTQKHMRDDELELLLDPRDRDDYQHVLVLARPDVRRFALVGWIPTREAKEIGRYADPFGHGRPCWIVPQSQLHPLKEIGMPL